MSLPHAETELGELLRRLCGIAVGVPTASVEELKDLGTGIGSQGKADDSLLVSAEWALRGFSAILAGWVETALHQVFTQCDPTFPRNARWNSYERFYQTAARRDISDLPGYKDHVWKVRTLANSFKHNDGVATSEDAAALGVPEGSQVVYLLQDWDAHVAGAVHFCKEVIATLPPLQQLYARMEVAMEDGSTLICPIVQLPDGTRLPIPMARKGPEGEA